MAIADTIQSMYTNVGNVYDTITNVTPPSHKNIENIPNTIKESYLEIMNNGIDVVWDNWDKVTGTGTSFTLNNTIVAPTKTILKPSEIVQNGTPTPDYPIKIHNVNEENSIAVGNDIYSINLGTKNLLKVNSTLIDTRANNGIYRTPIGDGDKMFISGTATSNSGYFTSNDNEKQRLKAGTYTFFTDAPFEITLQTKDLTTTTVLNQKTSDGKKTFTLEHDCSIINGILHFQSGTKYLQTIGIYLVEGNETKYAVSNPIEYCKIGDYEDSFIRSTGKNLFDTDILISPRTTRGVAMSIEGGKTIKLYGQCNQNNLFFTANDDNKLLVKAGTYTFSSNCSVNVQLQCKNASDNSTFVINKGTSTTQTDDFYIYNGMIQAVSGSSYNEIFYCQLEKGETVTEYEPFGTDWYVKKEIGKVVLDGSENWSMLDSSIPFKLAISDIMLPSSNSVVPSVLSDYYKVVAWSTLSSAGNYCISMTSNESNLRVRNNDITTLDNFKTWLSNNNVLVYYVLNAPTYTEVPETLANQLEAIYKAKSKNGQTNVMQENTDLPFIINMSALV